jgi:formylglycine-generating enzyme required for sulfatase activity
VQRKKSRPTALIYGVIGAVVVAAVALSVILATRARSSPPVAAQPPVDSGMVLIPAGTYTIGANDGPASARPAHQVSLGAFGVGSREVTVGEYQQFIAARTLDAPWTTKPDDAVPVTGVTHSEASNYCAWKHPGGGRLPTEEEWEAAARGSSGRRYPWGDAWNPAAANVAATGRGSAVAVGSFPAGRTPDGLDDLIGNVWEWTSSPFRAYGDTARRSSGLYVIRGGGYNALQSVANAVSRGQLPPVTDRANLAATGFRCAMPARPTAAR